MHPVEIFRLIPLAAGIASASPAPLSCRAVSLDMTCGGATGNTCPSGLCCSQNGWCGSSADYCGQGCQSGFGACASTGTGTGSTSEDGRCGAQFGNAVCASTECCSFGGFCGTTKDHCKAPDCQFQFGPACDANKTPGGPSTSGIGRTKIGSVLYGGDGIYKCVNKGDVALTFDDGPFIYTGALLDLLNKYNAKATFFVTGNNNGKGQIDDANLPWPGLLKRMFNEGHQIASHTWSHADLCKITQDQRKAEMVKLEMAVRNVLGAIPTYMRPPYSSCTSACGCAADMAELGYHVVYFDLDTRDYLNDSPALVGNSKALFDGGFSGGETERLVIAHDIHKTTVNSLAEHMLQGIASRGLRAVTVGECLGDPSGNWYRS